MLGIARQVHLWRIFFILYLSFNWHQMGFKIAKNSVIEREYEVNGTPSIS